MAVGRCMSGIDFKRNVGLVRSRAGAVCATFASIKAYVRVALICTLLLGAAATESWGAWDELLLERVADILIESSPRPDCLEECSDSFPESDDWEDCMQKCSGALAKSFFEAVRACRATAEGGGSDNETVTNDLMHFLAQEGQTVDYPMEYLSALETAMNRSPTLSTALDSVLVMGLTAVVRDNLAVRANLPALEQGLLRLLDHPRCCAGVRVSAAALAHRVTCRLGHPGVVRARLDADDPVWHNAAEFTRVFEKSLAASHEP